jgi:hypothetical protein
MGDYAKVLEIGKALSKKKLFLPLPIVHLLTNGREFPIVLWKHLPPKAFVPCPLQMFKKWRVT